VAHSEPEKKDTLQSSKSGAKGPQPKAEQITHFNKNKPPLSQN